MSRNSGEVKVEWNEALFVGMDLGRSKWVLAATAGPGARPVRREVPAGDWAKLSEILGGLKRRFRLSAEAAVYSCYEAGRDGFWVHRGLAELGVRNFVVDSSSIRVERRARRRKTDRLDAEQLVRQLLQYVVWQDAAALRVVQVPGEEDEDDRQWHRLADRLGKERKRVINRMRSLLAQQGIVLKGGWKQLLYLRVEKLRDWQGKGLGPGVSWALRSWQEVLRGLVAQEEALEAERQRRLEEEEADKYEAIRQLAKLKGMSWEVAWTFVMELGWREIRNRRQLGALTGLCGTPWRTGQQQREQGIGKHGIGWLSGRLVQQSWLWVRWQPHSELTKWWKRRFAEGSKRQRKVGIVAVARRLAILLWRWLETGELPEGVLLKAAS